VAVALAAVVIMDQVPMVGVVEMDNHSLPSLLL
jgi:hypothetical protein